MAGGATQRIEGRVPAGCERLPGEDDSSELLSDARHWAAVYEELARGVAEIAGTPPVVARYAWIAHRRDYWRRRWKNLRDRLA